MLQSLRKLWLATLIIAAVVAIAVMLKRETAGFVWPTLVSARYLAYACVAQVVFWWAAAVMWTAVSRVVADTRGSIWNSFQQLALVGLGKYLPGKVWGMVARGSQMTAQGVSMQRVAVATFYEQAIMLHGALVTCTALLVFLQPSTVNMIVAGAAALSTLIGGRLSTLVVRVGGWLASRAGLGFSHDELSPISPVRYFGLVVGYAVIWILIGLVVVCLYRAFVSTSLNLDTALGLIMANAIAITAGFFALFAPGGVGVREGVGATVLTAWISLPAAITLVVLYRIWATAMDGVAGLTVLPILRDSLRERT